MDDNNLLSLLQLSDPTLPIGGYAHSSGLETYVQQGVVKDLSGAKDFVVSMLSRSLRYTDAAFLSMAYDAGNNKDLSRILELDEECTAVKLPLEVRKASQKLGIRLGKIFQPLLRDSLAGRYLETILDKTAYGHYCLVFGCCANALGISLENALTGFYYNAAAGMITNCVKLIPLGQQDGQELLFSLQPLIIQLVRDSLVPDPDLTGLCCTGFDIRCMQHEELYSRLYMS